MIPKAASPHHLRHKRTNFEDIFYHHVGLVLEIHTEVLNTATGWHIVLSGTVEEALIDMRSWTIDMQRSPGFDHRRSDQLHWLKCDYIHHFWKQERTEIQFQTLHILDLRNRLRIVVVAAFWP